MSRVASSSPRSPKPAFSWAVFFGCTLGTAALGLLAGSVNGRREESATANRTFLRPVPKGEPNSAKWGANFPDQQDGWAATAQMDTNTKFGGSGARDYLAQDPRLVILFAGYGFSKEYKAPRGHMHAVEDVTSTKRLSEKTPATCWTCKSPDVPRLMAQKGTKEFYASKFSDLHSQVKNPIGCADCHDAETMKLKVTRPALKEAWERQGKDISKATHQEMRTLVCAQCHVEYYFKGKKENYLTFPWDKGTRIEDMDAYYAEDGHIDWTHPISGAKMVKMQHPDYELYKESVHYSRGVSCADCHMPYSTKGGVKVTDHQIRSPLYNPSNSCGVCHRWSESELKQRVTKIQSNHREVLDITETALVEAHLTIGDAMRLGATDAELEKARSLVVKGQMYWDYIAANNGMGFHAPQEGSRVLNKASRYAQEARLAAEMVRVAHGASGAYALPDLSTKAKATAWIAPYVQAQKDREALKVAAK